LLNLEYENYVVLVFISLTKMNIRYGVYMREGWEMSCIYWQFYFDHVRKKQYKKLHRYTEYN